MFTHFGNDGTRNDVAIVELRVEPIIDIIGQQDNLFYKPESYEREAGKYLK